jgi:hypothetical protein
MPRVTIPPVQTKAPNTERFTNVIPKSFDFRPMLIEVLNISTSRIAPRFLFNINVQLVSASCGCSDAIAVGMLIAEHPPHRSRRA